MSRLGLVTVALSLCLAFTLGVLFSSRSTHPGPEYRQQSEFAREAARVLDSGPLPARRFTQIAQRLHPSVVSILGHDGREGSSRGTGVLLNRSGDVLTNLHVIDGMRNLMVTLSSHESYRASVVGVDAPTDLAVLRIRAGNDLAPVVFGDSEAVQVGEQVLAIGNSLGFGWSVTSGIVSSLHRSSVSLEGDPVDRRYKDFIQTDAALGPGNSGGPLVNMRGEVIGINSLILSDDRSAGPIGFAIPSADALFVATELIASGTVERGFLGIKADDVRDLSRSERHRKGLDWMHGVSVTHIVEGSPAHKAGLRPGDVLLEMAGREIPDLHALRCRIARTKAETRVEFIVMRDGAKRKATAVLSTRSTS